MLGIANWPATMIPSHHKRQRRCHEHRYSRIFTVIKLPSFRQPEAEFFRKSFCNDFSQIMVCSVSATEIRPVHLLAREECHRDVAALRESADAFREHPYPWRSPGIFGRGILKNQDVRPVFADELLCFGHRNLIFVRFHPLHAPMHQRVQSLDHDKAESLVAGRDSQDARVFGERFYHCG